MEKKFNLNSKYLFSNQLIEYLNIPNKSYTINEIKDIVKVKIFNNKKNKQLTWDEIFLFNLDDFKMINYNHMIRLIINNFIIKNENQPNCKFYYYYQIPVEVKDIKKLN
jgi:hypothetical protein